MLWWHQVSRAGWTLLGRDAEGRRSERNPDGHRADQYREVLGLWEVIFFQPDREAPGYKSGFLSSHGQLGNDAPSSPRLPEAFAIHIAIHISVVYDGLPMTYSAVRALPCR
jgi:hypothetical protein